MKPAVKLISVQRNVIMEVNGSAVESTALHFQFLHKINSFIQ